MRILCVSDQIDPLVYSTSIKSRFSDIDLILCAGDLSMDYIDFIVSTLNRPAYFVFGNHNLNEYGVYHKVNNKKIEVSSIDLRYSHGAVYCGFKAISDKQFVIKMPNGKPSPLLIAGISGSMRYNRGLNQYTNTQMLFRLFFLVPKLLLNRLRYGRFLDIFLTHAAPRGVHDREDLCHRGFDCFNIFLKLFHPLYMVHGHIHLYDTHTERFTKIASGTCVVNAYSHYIIDFPNDMQKQEGM